MHVCPFLPDPMLWARDGYGSQAPQIDGLVVPVQVAVGGARLVQEVHDGGGFHAAL